MALQIIIALIILTVLAIIGKKLSKHKALFPLMPFKYNFNLRRDTFRETLQLLEKRNGKLIIETGTSRDGLKNTAGDGAATIVFGKWAEKNGGEVLSVDISEDSIKGAQQGLDEESLNNTVSLHLSDSIAFLENFDRPIDLLYLDSYDYSLHDTDIQLKSQEHHLKEYIVAEKNLHKNSIILIDDCDLPGGGKGKIVLEHLLQKGWVVLTNAYQILLVKKESIS